MKTYLLAALAFFVGMIAVLGLRYLQIKTVSAPQATSPQITPQPTFALVPPSQAVSGVLTVIAGHTEKFSRNTDAYAEASTGAQILTGESLATKDKSSAAASVSGIVTATLQENAELVFANLFPTDMVLQQKNGKIQYDVTDTGHPVAVRALHALVSINSGEVIINIVDTDMSVTVSTGSVQLALVDTHNNTHAWNLKAGQRANIDDAAREVYFLKTR